MWPGTCPKTRSATWSKRSPTDCVETATHPAITVPPVRERREPHRRVGSAATNVGAANWTALFFPRKPTLPTARSRCNRRLRTSCCSRLTKDCIAAVSAQSSSHIHRASSRRAGTQGVGTDLAYLGRSTRSRRRCCGARALRSALTASRRSWGRRWRKQGRGQDNGACLSGEGGDKGDDLPCRSDPSSRPQRALVSTA
jgi:hypothetical protein